MYSTSVAVNLAGLIPLSVLAWLLVLPRKDEGVFARIFWWPLAAVVMVSLGGFLGAAVGSAFDEPLSLAPFSWVERPLFAFKVISVCAFVGAGWSYGLACIAARILTRHRWVDFPSKYSGI